MERFAIKIDERVKLSLYNICRLCGIDNRDQVPIVEEPDTTFVLDDEPSLCKKIVDCVGIQVKTTDRMPQKICILCVDKINDFYEYREMCKATNMQTRELLGLPPEIKDEKPTGLVSPSQQPFVEIPAENMKRKRKLKSECINYEEIDDDEIDEKPPKKKFPKNSVGAKSKKLLASRRIIVKRESVKPIPSRILPIREKAFPVPKEKPATLIKEKLIISPIKEKILKEKSTTVKEKNPVVKEKAQIMKEKIVPQLVKGKGQLSKEKLQLTKEKLPPQIKDKPSLVKEKPQPVKEKAQIEKEKLKPVKDKTMPTSSKFPILKEKLNKEKTTLKEKLIPLFEEKIEPASSKLDMELITLKTPNRRERQRELETKKKRKNQTSQPLEKVKSESLYSCIVCPKEFKTQPEYDIHFFRDHTPNTLEHGCSACREAFYDLQEYRDHQLWHRLSSIPFSCFKCDSHFDRITAYTRHFLTSCVPHIEYNIFDDIKCPKCHKTFVTKNLYEWHGCLIKNNSKCPRCSKFFAKRLNLQRHVVVCNDKIIETEPMVAEANNDRSDTNEVVAFTSNDGKNIVKVEPGSILEIEDESHVAVSNINDDDAHEIDDSVEDDVGFQDDPEDETEDTITSKTSTIINVSTEINNLKNLDKDSSDIIPILDDIDSNPVRPIKQEKVDRRYDDVICRASTANIPMVQIKQEIFNTDYIDQVDLNILRNIKPEPVESVAESNNSKNVCSASVSEGPNQTNKVVAAKPTLKLKIKKEHGTLNSSFIDSDLGEGGDSSPNPNRSNDDEYGTSHHRKKRNKHKKKIYKIPKQLALIIKQEKKNRDDRESPIPEDHDVESRITVPVISEVTSIAESVLETTNAINQMEYFEEEEDTTLSVCVSGHSREFTEDVELSIEPQNDVQIPVIAEVVSLKQSEPCLPLISSVTSLSSSGIRVKMEFSNFASPRSDSYEPVIASDNRIEQDDMITGNYMGYDTVENTNDHLEHTDSEDVTLSTTKDSIESDIEEKPNLDEFNVLSEINSKTIQDSTTAVVALGQISSSDRLTDIANISVKSIEIVSNKELSQLPTDFTERIEIDLQENLLTALDVKDPDESEKSSENEYVIKHLIKQNDNETIENVKTIKEELVLVATEATSQDMIIRKILPEITPTIVKGNIEKENEKCEFNTEINMKPYLQPVAELTETEVNKAEELENYACSENVLKCNPEIDNPIVGISMAQENTDCDEPKSTVVQKLYIGEQYENIEKLKPVSSDTADGFGVISTNEIKTNIIDLVQSNIPVNTDPANINPDISNRESQEIFNCETTNSTIIDKLGSEQHNIENVNPVIISTVDGDGGTALVEFKASPLDLTPSHEILDNDAKKDNSDVIVSVIQEKDNFDEPNSTVIHKLDGVQHYENIEIVNLVGISTGDKLSGIAHEEFKESELDLMKSDEIPDNDNPKIENPYVSVIQENVDNVESNSTVTHKLDPAEHYQYIENVNPVSTILAVEFNAIVNNDFKANKLDLVQSNDIPDTDEFKVIELDLVETEISHNIENDTAQPQLINTPEIDQECHETSFQNIQIEPVTDCDTKANDPIELVLSAKINVHVETAKRHLEIDDNTEESNHKIKKKPEDYLDRDVALEVKLPLEFRVSHIMDESIQLTQDSSIINSNKIISELELEQQDKLRQAVNIDDHCNEDKIEEDRQRNTTLFTEDVDIYPYQIKPNILDVEIESSNSNNTTYSQTIKTDILEGEQDNIDLENRDETVETDRRIVQSCNIIENKTNEEYDNELMKWESNELYSTSNDERDQDNRSSGKITDPTICDPIQEKTNSNNRGGETSINVSEQFTVTALELSMDVKEDNFITIQDESDISMEVEPTIISMNVSVQDDLNHDATESSIQYDEEDNINKIHQLSNEDLFVASEGQYHDEYNGTSGKFQNENDINMEKEDSSNIYEVKQGTLHEEDLSRQYNISSSEQSDQIVEDNSHKVNDENIIITDDEESISSDDAVSQYQLCGISKRQGDVSISESMIDSSNEMKHLYGMNMKNEESILSKTVDLQFEENLKEIISNKNECPNSVIKSGEILSNSLEFSSYGGEEKSSDDGLRQTALKEIQYCPVLHGELDEISDESCESPMAEKLSDAQLHEDRVLKPEIMESGSSSVKNEENLSIIVDSDDLDDFKKSEDICEPNSVYSTADTNTAEITTFETPKQVEDLKKSEASTCNTIDFITEKSLDFCVDSTSENSHNIKIEIKDYSHCPVPIIDINETSPHSLEVSQTEMNAFIGCINSTQNPVIENDGIINESAAELQTNDIIATNVETIPEKIQSISSDAILEQIASSQENFNDNLDNTREYELQTNLTDSIIYNAVENEEEIDSDLEKELLEESNDESIK